MLRTAMSFLQSCRTLGSGSPSGAKKRCAVLDASVDVTVTKIEVPLLDEELGRIRLDFHRISPESIAPDFLLDDALYKIGVVISPKQGVSFPQEKGASSISSLWNIVLKSALHARVFSISLSGLNVSVDGSSEDFTVCIKHEHAGGWEEDRKIISRKEMVKWVMSSSSMTASALAVQLNVQVLPPVMDSYFNALMLIADDFSDFPITIHNL